jgi:hypothetical protein
MNSINLNLNSVEVKASVRPLKAKWTREMATDVDHFSSSFEKYFAKELRRENRKNSINKIFNN